MAPCLDDEVEREAVQLYQWSCPAFEGGGLAVLPECALGVLALWTCRRIAAVVVASGSFWSVTRGRPPLRQLGP